MPQCCIPGCRNRTENRIREGCEKLSFFRFPSQKSRPALRDRWLVNIARENFSPSESSRICSEHFEEACFTYKRIPLTDEEKRTFIKNALVDDAVPTLFHVRPRQLSRTESARARRLQRSRTQQVTDL